MPLFWYDLKHIILNKFPYGDHSDLLEEVKTNLKTSFEDIPKFLTFENWFPHHMSNKGFKWFHEEISYYKDSLYKGEFDKHLYLYKIRLQLGDPELDDEIPEVEETEELEETLPDD